MAKPTTAPATAPAETPPPSMRVQAFRMGYYNEIRRRVGDVFTLNEPDHFSTKWMRFVDANTPEHITTGQQELRQAHQQEVDARRSASTVVASPANSMNPLGDD